MFFYSFVLKDMCINMETPEKTFCKQGMFTDLLTLDKVEMQILGHLILRLKKIQTLMKFPDHSNGKSYILINTLFTQLFKTGGSSQRCWIQLCLLSNNTKDPACRQKNSDGQISFV